MSSVTYKVASVIEKFDCPGCERSGEQPTRQEQQHLLSFAMMLFSQGEKKANRALARGAGSEPGLWALQRC